MLRPLLKNLIFSLALFMALPIIAARADVTIYCAASLVDLMEALAQGFEDATGEKVTIVAGASSTLARQIAAGAPADIYISANRDWVDHAVHEAGYRDVMPFVQNRLVIVAPEGNTDVVTLEELPQRLAGRRLALGDPVHVPAGIYAQQALKTAGVWDDLSDALAPAADVRAALALVARGAAPYGIVYATDARRDDVVIVGEIDPELHDPVVYYLARNPDLSIDADAFIASLKTEPARMIISVSGFEVVP